MEELMADFIEEYTEAMTTMYEKSGGVELDPHESPSKRVAFIQIEPIKVPCSLNDISSAKKHLDTATSIAFDLLVNTASADPNPRNLRYFLDAKTAADAMTDLEPEKAYETLREGFAKLFRLYLCDSKERSISVLCVGPEWIDGGNTVVVDVTPFFKYGLLQMKYGL